MRLDRKQNEAYVALVASLEASMPDLLRQIYGRALTDFVSVMDSPDTHLCASKDINVFQTGFRLLR